MTETDTATAETVFESESGDLRVGLTEESPTRKTLEIEVAAKRVTKAFDRAYKDLRREVRVKGFRPGKAPRAVLERMYGASLPAEIERTLVMETLGDAVKLTELQPLLEPGVEAEPPAPEASFRYKARLEVKPEIDLPELEGLPAQRPSVEVGEHEVLTHLEGLRERNAPILEEPEGTAADEGHFVVMDFVGKVDGEPFEGGSAEGHELELGSGRFIPGFEEQLVGARAGEDVEVSVKFPDDYAEQLAGKDAVFEVHVEAVKKRVLPELDDEFAKDQGEDFETLDDLRNKIREDMTEQRAKTADEDLKKSVMDALIARTDFEIPPGVIEMQLQREMQSFQQRFGQYAPEEMLQQQLARMAEEGRPAAERRVREAFLLEAVGKAQSVEVTDEDVDARLDELAEQQGAPPQQMRQMAQEQGWHASIRSELVDGKALEFLVAHAAVEEVAPVED